MEKKRTLIITRLYEKLQEHMELGAHMDVICKQFGISRQAHYQKRQRLSQRQVEEAVILELVRQIRRKHAKQGTRKLLSKLQPMLAAEGLKIGRDRLFELLGRENLLVHPTKRRRRTTIAGVLRMPNLLLGLEIERPNQVWVGDITYVDLENGKFAYLFLLMDLYSRFLLGWHVADNLLAEGARLCLQKALEHGPAGDLHPIHHSDHGVQYTSHGYLETLSLHGLRPSMGAVGNCYDNIYAERVIGTLKNEYRLGDCFVDMEQLQQLVPEAIYLYNYDRPHLSLDMLTPAQVYHAQDQALPGWQIQIPATRSEVL
jgi:transposase InsO family protein